MRRLSETGAPWAQLAEDEFGDLLVAKVVRDPLVRDTYLVRLAVGGSDERIDVLVFRGVRPHLPTWVFEDVEFGDDFDAAPAVAFEARRGV